MIYSVTGRITPMPDGSFGVDLRAVVETPSGKRAATSTLAKLTDDDIQREIDEARATIGAQLDALACDMADLLASENKSGKVAISKVLREIYRPLVSALSKGSSPEALSWGMEQAVAKGVPNVNYAKKAAESYGDNNGGPTRTSPPGPSGPSGRYDVIGGGA